ncbi:hypothetical protein CPB84DRAFT_1849383 [Gymnopilus junonius]|uniref:Uncharacterized protein n=1 Tax=Gymnopilus junonius TaxID=109634 RepID=A0A9P5TJS4_GYMJU|nr:hypothetical protein CPB84DRAFT_1849383 [Gymnopilus junonius]
MSYYPNSTQSPYREAQSNLNENNGSLATNPQYQYQRGAGDYSRNPPVPAQAHSHHTEQSSKFERLLGGPSVPLLPNLYPVLPPPHNQLLEQFIEQEGYSGYAQIIPDPHYATSRHPSSSGLIPSTLHPPALQRPRNDFPPSTATPQGKKSTHRKGNNRPPAYNRSVPSSSNVIRHTTGGGGHGHSVRSVVPQPATTSQFHRTAPYPPSNPSSSSNSANPLWEAPSSSAPSAPGPSSANVQHHQYHNNTSQGFQSQGQGQNSASSPPTGFFFCTWKGCFQYVEKVRITQHFKGKHELHFENYTKPHNNYTPGKRVYEVECRWGGCASHVPGDCLLEHISEHAFSVGNGLESKV